MKIGFGSLFKRSAEIEPEQLQARPSDGDDFWYESEDTFPGAVSPKSACTLAAVYACRVAISETLAMCPIGVFEYEAPGKVREAKDHPLYRILHDEPNAYTDSFCWVDAQIRNLIDFGNCLALKQWPRRTQSAIYNDNPTGLDIIYPEGASVKKVNGRLEYSYTEAGKRETRDQSEIFHISINSPDGIWGKSPFSIVGESFGLGLAQQRHAMKLFRDGAFFRGFVQSPKKFKTDEEARNFLRSIVKWLRRGNIGLLEDGKEFKPATMNNKDAQLLEGRQASVLDVCRILRVPPSFIAVTEGSKSYASVEQDAIFFLQYSLQTYATRFERAANRQLMNKARDNGDYFVKFNLDALLRGDLKSRTEAIVASLRAGLRSVNESRHLLDMNPIEEEAASKHFIQADLIPLDQVGKVEPAETKPAEEPKPDESERKRFAPLFEDLMLRAVRREVKSLRAMQQRPNFLKQASDFYKTHETYLRDSLAPACAAVSADFEPALAEFLTKFREARSETLIENPHADLKDLERDSVWYAGKLLSLLETKNHEPAST